MVIRSAGFEELDAVADLAREAHQRSRFAPIPADNGRARFMAQLREAVRATDQALLVAIGSRGAVGFLWGGLAPVYRCLGATMATDRFFYVSPARAPGMAAQGLIRAFRAWAIGQGAVGMTMATGSGLVDEKRLSRLYERAGLAPVGQVFEEAFSA